MKICKFFAILAITLAVAAGLAHADYEWAADGVSYCTSNGIMQGMGDGDLNLGGLLTKSQMAKMLGMAFNVKNSDSMKVSNVASWHWSYDYVRNFQNCIVKKDSFYPDENVTREEFTASLVLASGKNKGWVLNKSILEDNFYDYGDIDKDYNDLVIVAVERGYMMGANGLLRPKDNLTRAEAATLIYRVIAASQGKLTLELGIEKTETPLIGAPEVTVEQAQRWAKAKGAHQRFIDIAPTYWKYGELTGIRPDILYAQAAKQSLISAEQIVTAEAIAMNEKQTILRAAQQPLLIEAPYGAYPCGYASRYSADEVWLTQYRQAQTDAGLLRTALPAFPASGSWYDYLQHLGFHRLMALTTNRRGE